MRPIIGRCVVCPCTDEAKCSPGCSWNRRGLCTACAGLGITLTVCKFCNRPVAWCKTESRGTIILVDFKPSEGIEPDLVIGAGDGLPASKRAHTEYIRLQVFPGGPLRSGVNHFANCGRRADREKADEAAAAGHPSKEGRYGR